MPCSLLIRATKSLADRASDQINKEAYETKAGHILAVEDINHHWGGDEIPSFLNRRLKLTAGPGSSADTITGSDFVTNGVRDTDVVFNATRGLYRPVSAVSEITISIATDAGIMDQQEGDEIWIMKPRVKAGGVMTTGTTMTAVVASGESFVTDGVVPGDNLYNVTKDLLRPIDTVDSETQVTLTDPITGNEAGDQFVIVPETPTCIVFCTDLDLTTAQQYSKMWDMELTYVIDASNDNGVRATISATNAGITLGKIESTRVSGVLALWGATIVTSGDNSVQFDLGILNAIQSVHFLGFPNVTWTHLGFSEGIHTVEADYGYYSTTEEPPENVERLVQSRGGTVIAHDTDLGVVTFTIPRSTVLTAFWEFVQKLFFAEVSKHQYYFSPADTAIVLARGGMVVIDSTTLLSYIKNRAND